MLLMSKDSSPRKKRAAVSPRTRLPHIGKEHVIEEGSYQGDSPIVQRSFDPDGAYENDFDEGTQSDDGGRQRVRNPGNPRANNEMGLNSRADGRAWEDGDMQEEKDPMAAGFRELRILSQLVRKKASSKDFESEMTAFEVKMKRLQTFAVGEYNVVKRELKAQKISNKSLQQSLKSAHQTVNQTMSQALEDVTLLTQKLRSVEENFSQVRVDKDHIEKGFRSELGAVQAKNSSLQKNLLSCKLELEDLSHRIKSSDDLIRQLTFDKLESQKEANTLRSQLSVFEDDFSSVKQREAKAVKDVMLCKDELEASSAHHREQNESFNAHREMANAELVRLQVAARATTALHA